MNLDATFRPFVIAGFWLVIVIALPFRIRSQATGEKLDRTQEGMTMMIVLRLTGLAVWAGVIAFMIDPPLMAWSSLPLPAATRWAGVGLTIITAGLLLWTLRSLGPNLTDTVVTRAAHTLVTRGPYRWVRHPFYDCMALFVASTALMMANWFVAARTPRAHRGRQAVGTVWGALSRVPRRNRAFPAAVEPSNLARLRLRPPSM
jgi:protein-S-isoprenylcysteine O-methyltransferase Ste14